MYRFVAALCAITLLGAVPVRPQEQHNLWVMWERMTADNTDPQLRSHLMLNVPPDQAQMFFENLIPSAQTYGTANVVHSTSPLCLAQPEAPDFQTIDTTGMEVADKLTTLRGLQGVFVDFRAVRGPRTFEGDFGAQVHDLVLTALQQAGVPLLSKEQVAITPGRPTLTLRYSHEVTGCRPWSLSIGVKQTSVLTRDTSVLLAGKTWNYSARQSEEDIDYNVFDALQDAVAVFVQDYAKANSVSAADILAKTAPAN